MRWSLARDTAQTLAIGSEYDASGLELTGVQMNETLAMVFTMANEQALRSFVWPHVAETQPRIMELTA